MMPLLLHGPATWASRRKLSQLKGKYDPANVVIFESSANLGQVLASLMTIPIFSSERLVVWENPSEDFKLPTTNPDLIGANYQLSTSLVLWFDHEIDVKKWPDFEPLLFPESREVSIFPLLDYLAAKDKKAFLEVEKLKKAGFDIHYFLTMVFYLLRNLVNTPKNAPVFVRDKLQRQRKNFTYVHITSLYKYLLEMDFKIKSGFLEKDQAEFLLVNQFLN